MEFLNPLWPELIIQFLLGGFLLFLFCPAVPTQGSGSAAKCILLCALSSLVFLVLSLTIEVYASPIVFQGSLVVQWFLFVLLGQRICGIPLGKSMLTQFCFFSLMLGVGLWYVSPESFPEDDAPGWAVKLESALLTRRLPEIRADAQRAVYGDPRSEIPAEKAAVSPEPESTPEPPPQTLPGRLTGAEFEALVYSPPPAPEFPELPDNTLPFLAPEQTETPAEPEPMFISGVIEGATTLQSDQTTELTRVKNRSTDPRFTPPGYDIGAVSVGERGRFAMVEGRLLREGAILRTGNLEPRGWKLFKVTPSELFWQPLE